MAPTRTFVLAAAIAAAGCGYAALSTRQPPQPVAHRPAWTEIAWRFPVDQWGRGRAFRCRAADCGSEIDLYLRAKIGFCNCASTIDDEEVDRVADFDLVGGEPAARGPGQAVALHWMQGRRRTYALRGRGAGTGSVLVIALHERCDMVVATVAIAGEVETAHEDAVIELLNGAEARRWAEVALGL